MTRCCTDVCCRLAVLALALVAPACFSGELIPAPATFSPGEVDGPQHSRSGVVAGVSYRYYREDGSGSMQGSPDTSIDDDVDGRTLWAMGCERDAMSDLVTCYVSKGDLWLWAAKGRGHVVVSIGSEHYPGSSSAARVDSNKPIRTSAAAAGHFGVPESRALIAQMKAGKQITTRYMRWPNRYWIDHAQSLYGFEQALAYLNWAIAAAPP